MYLKQEGEEAAALGFASISEIKADRFAYEVPLGDDVPIGVSQAALREQNQLCMHHMPQALNPKPPPPPPNHLNMLDTNGKAAQE